MRGCWFAGFAAMVLACLSAGFAEAKPEARLFVSWKAPPGQPGALERLEVACNDTARADTLYLAFELPWPRPAITSMTAVLYFHPQIGDTLGGFWQFKTGWPNGGNMFIDFAPYTGPLCRVPWSEGGEWDLSYDHRSGRGRLDLSHTIAADVSSGLDPGVRYCYAAVRILSRLPSLSGCKQPICIEWAGARLRFATGREIEITSGEQRFARWNSAPDAPCGVPLKSKLARPWAPKLEKQKPDTETEPGHKH